MICALCILGVVCALLLCWFFIEGFPPTSQSMRLRKIARKHKVVTGPQYTELHLNADQRMNLLSRVCNVTVDKQLFVEKASYYYVVVKHVFNRCPTMFILCSTEPVKITSEMLKVDKGKNYMIVPISFRDTYIFLKELPPQNG